MHGRASHRRSYIIAKTIDDLLDAVKRFKKMDRIKAPFTPDQVMALWNYQMDLGKWAAHPMHPFTCGQREDHPELAGDKGVLIPTVRGWICPFCDYTQDWAHGFMAED